MFLASLRPGFVERQYVRSTQAWDRCMGFKKKRGRNCPRSTCDLNFARFIFHLLSVIRCLGIVRISLCTARSATSRCKQNQRQQKPTKDLHKILLTNSTNQKLSNFGALLYGLQVQKETQSALHIGFPILVFELIQDLLPAWIYRFFTFD